MTMPNALDVVSRFYEATNDRKDVALTAALIADDMQFIGPVIRTSGAHEYLALLEQFLPTHIETRMTTQFLRGDDVCSIYDLVQRTPSGGTITLEVADWIRVSDGKVAEQRIYYDPREFLQAYAAMLPQAGP
jgi:ketosteroid isomerase-like protein